MTHLKVFITKEYKWVVPNMLPGINTNKLCPNEPTQYNAVSLKFWLK